jgi:hypothetical protein
VAWLAIAAALALQPAPAPAPAPAATQPAAPVAQPAAPPTAAVPGQETVIQRTGDPPREVPISSRIARQPVDNVAADPAAAMYLREWADCIVRLYRPRALSLLATPLNSEDQAQIINQLTGNRFRRRTVCARFRSMRIDNLVLRGAVAEALWRWEDRRKRSAGPMPPAAQTAQEAADRAALLARLGRCVVNRDPQAAARVMATRPATRSSNEALAALRQHVAACAPPGLPTQSLHPLTLRGALGEPHYLKARTASSAPANETAEPATPTT